MNISTHKVGGLRFLKVGRLQFSACVTRSARPIANGDSVRIGRNHALAFAVGAALGIAANYAPAVIAGPAQASPVVTLASCDTDSDCAARFGGDGSPTPSRLVCVDAHGRITAGADFKECRAR